MMFSVCFNWKLFVIVKMRCVRCVCIYIYEYLYYLRIFQDFMWCRSRKKIIKRPVQDLNLRGHSWPQ